MKKIETENAPKAIGPYAQGIAYQGVLYLSGILPINPKTQTLELQSIETATRQCLDNMIALLEAGNSTIEKVIKVTVLLSNIQDFTAMNTVYATYFKEHLPARVAYQVAALPMGSCIEIEVIAGCE